MHIKFKEDVNPLDLLQITKNCSILLLAVWDYMRDNNLEMVITSLKSDRANVKAVSKTHETGRAFDMRIKHLSPDQIDEISAYFNSKYRNIAAVSAKSNTPICAVVKPDHIHFQVSA